MTPDLATKLAIWIGTAGWAAGVALCITARRSPRAEAWARRAWTAGCIGLVIHVILALHYRHGWSFASAWHETARQTAEAFGPYDGNGVYLNYAMTCGWIADVALWWLSPERHRRRAPWLAAAWHGFLAFMFFNATVVFGHGPVRWVGVATFVALAALWLRSAAIAQTESRGSA